MYTVHVATIVEALNYADGQFYILLGQDHQGLHQLPGGLLKSNQEQPRYAAARHLRQRIKHSIAIEQMSPIDPLIYSLPGSRPDILIATFRYRWKHDCHALPPVSTDPCKEIAFWQWHAEEELARSLSYLPITNIHQGPLERHLNKARNSLQLTRTL